MRFWKLRPAFEWFRDVAVSGAARVALPETCAGCGRTGAWMCGRCTLAIEQDDPPGCHRCGRRGSRRQQCLRCNDLFPACLHQVRAGYSFRGPVRRAVHRVKYNGEFQRGYDLGERLSERVHSLFPHAEFDVIVPVPLHSRRYRSRGFNQAAVIAEPIAARLGIPVVEHVRRVRNTAPQVGLPAEERLANLTDAFTVDPDKPELSARAGILIVDDVTTTGATLAAVAESLELGGAKSLYGLALAREQ